MLDCRAENARPGVLWRAAEPALHRNWGQRHGSSPRGNVNQAAQSFQRRSDHCGAEGARRFVGTSALWQSTNVRKCEGFRMPAHAGGFGRGSGPASESLQGRKPRPRAVRYGDFAARPGGRDRARRGSAARCSDQDARKLRLCCTWEGSGIAARSISAIGPNGIARSLAEIGRGFSGSRCFTIVMMCRS